MTAEAPPLEILIVDDEKNIRATLRTCLEAIGAHVVEAATAQAAREAGARQPFDLSLLDLRLGQENGLTLIPPLLAASPLVEIVVITAYGTIDNAVEAIQIGARDMLQKPFTPAQVRALAERVQKRRGLEKQLQELQSPMASSGPEMAFEGFRLRRPR
jgi:NtrC-family two-component system response regulator AlgB